VTRLVVGDPQPVTSTLRSGVEGTPAAATGTVTVTVTADDGTAIATNAATSTSSTGVYSWTPTAAMLSQPDIWTLVWSDKTGSTLNRQVTTYVKVTGAVTLTPYEMRERYADQLGGTAASRWTATRLADAIAAAEYRAEQLMRCAPVPSYARFTTTGDGGTKLFLPRPYLRELRQVTVDGGDVALADLDTLHDELCPIVTGYGWTKDAPVVVRFEHGLDAPPATVVDAIAATARLYASRSTSAVPDRAERWQPAGAGGFYSLAMPTANTVGLPEADAIFEAERWKGGDLW